MEKPIIPRGEWLVSIQDVKQLYLSIWKQLCKWAVLGAFLFFLYFGSTEAVYQAEGSFKEAAEKTNHETFLKEFLGGLSLTAQSQATSLMKSHQVLKPLIKKLGLQIQPISSEWKMTQLLRRYRENWQAARGHPLKELDSFLFSDICYEGEKKGFFSVVFLNEREFTLFDRKKRKLAVAQVGFPVSFEGITFTLKKVPRNLKMDQKYSFSIANWVSTLEEVSSRIKIQNDKDNASLIRLSFQHRDRHLAALLVNEWMSEYQAYLKREYDSIAEAQLGYLEEKQAQIFVKMDQLLDQHIAYLSQNLEKGGFVELDQETQSLMVPYHQMRSKLLSIDVELKRLAEIEGKEEIISLAEDESHSFNQIAQKIQELKQQKNLIEISLSQITEPALQARNEIGQDDFFASFGKTMPHELEGIDLASARQLFLQYNGKLDAAESSLRYYARLKKEIQEASFDLASLSSVLLDPLSQKILAEAARLELLLKDEKHYSAKEEERWKEEIGLQRKILMGHLHHLTAVEELNAHLMREKMGVLQRVSLDGINEQISVLYGQAKEGVKERQKALGIEKEILEKKMEEIRASLAAIWPEKWRFEKWLGIKTAMVNKVMETVTEVVESKTMASQMHHVESKPLDLAWPPILPKPSPIFRMTLLGGLIFPLWVFSIIFIRKLSKGFPVTYEKLKALHVPVLGKIGTFCDGKAAETLKGCDLETLRRIALFSEGAKVIGLIGGKGPDYSYALCENLARRSSQFLLIHCDFSDVQQKEDEPGLLQIWKGESLFIRQEKGFGRITAGGTTSFGTEILQSPQFATLLSRLKQDYTWIFLLLKSPLSSVESQSVLEICDKAIVTVCGEQIEELTPFIHWGYDEDNCRVTFITSA